MDPHTADITRALTERMDMRKKQLDTIAGERKIEREKLTAIAENVDNFYVGFQAKKEQLERDIEMDSSIESSDLKIYLDKLVVKVKDIQLKLNESSMFLASFQIKKAQEVIDQLNEKVQQRIQELQPKKKFGFRTKVADKKEKSMKSEKFCDSADGVDSKSSINVINDILEKRLFGFKDVCGETLVKSPNEVENRQLSLQNLTDCKVIILGNPSAIQFASLKDCIVIIGPTTRSAFIKDCHGCVFVMACQQVRIHDSDDTQFYLHVTGAAIIENCQQIQFAPYNLKYPDLDLHYEQSGLDRNVNNWDKIDDFSWLNENEKSPNFVLIEECDYKSDWL